MPDEIKQRVQKAYLAALSSNVMRSRSGSGLFHLTRDIKLYGREAGLDFVETNLDAIAQAAIDQAECRDPSMAITLSGWGRAAVAGAGQALQEATGLKVEVSGSALTVIWAAPNPGLV